MFRLEFDYSNQIRLRDALGRFSKGFRHQYLDAASKEAARVLLNGIRSEMPEGETGAMINSLFVDRESEFVYNIVSSAWYTRYVMFGAEDPYFIVAGLQEFPETKARNYRGAFGAPNEFPKKLLWWPGMVQNASGNTWGYPYVARDPVDPNRFDERGYDKAQPEIYNIFGKLFERIRVDYLDLRNMG